MSKKSDSSAPGFIALIPAAGVGSRLPGIGMSKEMLPVPVHGAREADTPGPEPVICHLLRALRLANVIQTRLVLRTGKWDIPEHLSNTDWDDMNLRYTITRGTSGVPETIATGLADLPDANVLFGFPDILFEPTTALARVAERLTDSDCDVVLGAFPTGNPSKMDMIGTGCDGRVEQIDIKRADSALDLTWTLAAWRPSFTTYLVDVQQGQAGRLAETAAEHDDLHLGHVLQLAIEDGLRVDAESFPDGRVLDIGTPDDLERAAHWLAAESRH